MIKSRGSFVALFDRPVAVDLGIFTLMIRSIPFLLMVLERRKAASNP